VVVLGGGSLRVGWVGKGRRGVVGGGGGGGLRVAGGVGGLCTGGEVVLLGGCGIWSAVLKAVNGFCCLKFGAVVCSN
jgi:hypothetical protein